VGVGASPVGEPPAGGWSGVVLVPSITDRCRAGWLRRRQECSEPRPCVGEVLGGATVGREGDCFWWPGRRLARLDPSGGRPKV